MPTISPVVTVSSTPGIEITTSAPGVDYQALLSGLGVIVLKVITLYYASTTLGQFNSPLKYSVYDANGNIAREAVVTPISPNQFLPSKFVQLKNVGIIINGQSGLDFNMLPGNQIQFIFYCIQNQNQDAIDYAGYINNFEEIQSEMGIPGFFDSSDYIDPHTEEVFPEI